MWHIQWHCSVLYGLFVSILYALCAICVIWKKDWIAACVLGLFLLVMVLLCELLCTCKTMPICTRGNWALAYSSRKGGVQQ